MLVSLLLTLLLYSVAHVLVLSDTHRVQSMFDYAGWGGVDKGCRWGRDLLHRGVNRDLPSHHSARLA